MNLKRYVLANPEARLPMPDRGGRLFRATGETVNADDAFWAARIRDAELVVAEAQTPPHRRPSGATSPRGERRGEDSSASRAAPSAARTGPPTGRANVPDGQSALRPAADGPAAINDIPPALPVKRKGK